MAKTALEADRAARNTTRFLLVLQAAAALLVIWLVLLGRVFPALLIAIVALLILLSGVGWLYLRYRSLPAVREKAELQRLRRRFSHHLQREQVLLQTAMDERDDLARLEQEQIERLPDGHTGDQLQTLRQKYRSLREQNSAAERKAQASLALLEHELSVFKPRLKELAALTFAGYLGQGSGAGRLLGAGLVILLVLAQWIASLGALGSAVRAALPPENAVPTDVAQSVPEILPTTTETATPAFTNTPPPSVTPLPTMSSTPTVTLTSPAALSASVPACIPRNTASETGLVVAVTDGDTIQVSLDGRIVPVRYIGIDAPEEDQLLYAEASAFNQQMVYNKTVTLVRDTSETDRFDRLLRYVIVGDVFVNQALVEHGFARAAAYAPDTACVSALESAQNLARTAAVGLWMPTEQAFVPPVTGGENASSCDPAYPGVCIPPPPPDLDCGDISFERFQVLPPDPHRFDGDADGVGCEG